MIKKTVAFHTLGCKVNEYESEKLSKELEARGWIPVSFSDDAAVYVVNTCSVTKIADHKSRQILNRAASQSKKNGAVTVAMGCYASIEKSGLTADLIIDNKDRDRAADLIEELFEREASFEDEPGPSFTRPRQRTRAFIKIEDGCDSFCSYCIIPYARGPVRSISPDEIIREAKECALAGIKEIVITGINVNRYGAGLITERPAFTGEPLAELLSRIAEETGIGRIRLSSVEPGLINKDFVSRIVEIKSVCPHFHMALQSGSGSVLKRMNRRYTPEEYMKSVELLRRYYDDPALTTDVIVGFPGEIAEEHRKSMDFIRAADLSKLNVFRFSGRPGTPAFSMKGQIRNAVKEERAHEMLALGDELRASYEQRHRGRVLEVLLEEAEENGAVSGYSKEYIRVTLPAGTPGEIVQTTF